MSLTVLQCIGAVLLIAAILTFLVVALIAGTATTIQAIQNLTGQTR